MGLALTQRKHKAAIRQMFNKCGAQPIDNIGAVGFTVITSQRCSDRIQLRRRGLLHQHAIYDCVHRVKIPGVLICLQAPFECDLEAGGTRFLIIARAGGRIAQIRVFQLGNDRLRQPSANTHGCVNGDSQLSAVNLTNGAAQIEPSGAQGDSAGVHIHHTLTAFDNVSIRKDGIANAADTVLRGLLDLIQFSRLQPLASAEQMAVIALARVKAVVIAFYHPVPPQKLMTNSKVWRLAALRYSGAICSSSNSVPLSASSSGSR